ncbi:MAG TPA: glycosyltransferase family 9 protein [Capillimicrobium sp.]|nr:glycosyltransferase family 9 protein [Capillimicrobium sp.]
MVVTLRALGLGDLLAAVPALRAVRRAFPAERHLLAAPAALEPLARLSGAVDAVVDTAPLAPLAPVLHGADVLVNLHGRGPQSHGVALAAAPHRLIAFAHPDIPETAGAPAWRAGEHERDRWCRLLRECGIPADPGDVRLPEPDVAPPPQAVGATVVHPGAAAPARRWPPERFAALARAERQAGRPVVVTGSAAEAPLARRVAEAAGLPAGAVLAGRTDLLGLAATIAAARRVVSGDTGVAHLAVAFGIPSLTLFGPIPPSEWGPPPGGRHRVLWGGRRGDPHADRVDPGLYAIEVPEALDELRRAS